MNPQHIIYALIDPTTNQVRYIGLSSKGLERARRHSSSALLSKDAANPHKCNWIRSLQARGLKYEIEVLEEFSSPDELNEAEVFWIGYFRMIGADLTNKTLGGEGVRGLRYKKKLPVSPETREKIAASKRGKPRDPATREKLSAAKKGKKYPNRKRLSPEYRERISEALKGRKPSEETKIKRAESMKKYWDAVRQGDIRR